MQPFRKGNYRYLSLPQENIDTDQIVPARFLTTTSREELGQKLFYDRRFNDDGSKRVHVLNDRAGFGAIVTGPNFGCGSSREHAAWALYDYGIRVVITESIADIFLSNALKNGILPVVLPRKVVEPLLAYAEGQVDVDLQAQRIVIAGRAHSFEVDAFSRDLLLMGGDELDYLLRHMDAIERYEARTRLET